MPEDHLSQQTKNEQSKNGRAGFFQTSKEGKYYFYGLDIFIFVICGLREILRVPLTEITFKRKWKVLMVFLFCFAHWFSAWGKEAEVLDTAFQPWNWHLYNLYALGSPSVNWDIFWPEAFSHLFSSIYWMSTMCGHSSL